MTANLQVKLQFKQIVGPVEDFIRSRCLQEYQRVTTL